LATRGVGIKFANAVYGRLRGGRTAQHLKHMAAIVHFHMQRVFQQAQVLVLRAAQPRQALAVMRRQLQRLTHSLAQAAPALPPSIMSMRPRSELSRASVIMMSTNCPTKRSWPSKLTQRLESVRPAN